MLIDAPHVALEHAEVAFRSVGMRISANIFPYTMAHGLMLEKHLTNRSVVARLIGPQGRLIEYFLLQNRLQSFGINFRYMS